MAAQPTHNPLQPLILFDLDGTLTNPKLGITSGVQHALQKLGIEAASLDELEFFIGPPLSLTFKQTYGLSEAEINRAVSYYREYYDPIGWSQNEVYSGIPEALAALREAGFQLGLATSKPTVFAERILTHFGLRDEFSLLAGSNLDGTREDKAEVIRYALAEAGFDVETALAESAEHQEAPVEASAGASVQRAAEPSAASAGGSAAASGVGSVQPSEGAYVQAAIGASGGLPVTMVGDRKYDIIGAKKLGLRSIGVTYGFGSREELESAGADIIIDHPAELVEVLLHTRSGK